MPINTRAKKREPVSALAEYGINDATEKTVKLKVPANIKSTLLDISVLGCSLDSQYLIPPGVILDIKIDPQSFNEELCGEKKIPLQFVGKVKSCVMRTGGHYRLGLQFINPEKENVELINNFIASKERRKTPRWNITK